MTNDSQEGKLQILVLGLLLCSALFLVQFSTGFSQGPNNRNVSVDTTVNVTGSGPEIIEVFLGSPITLSAGGLQEVTCNFSVRDYNGFADIDTVNMTFFYPDTDELYDPDENNTHYTNSSCSVIPGEQGGEFANYTCSVQLNYYAVNGTWNCTGYANDSLSLANQNSSLATVNALFALNVTTLIDYGEMVVGDISSNQTANVSNIGNQPINVSVRGYGAALDDGLGFVCDSGTLSVGLQRFAGNFTSNYTQKQALAASYQDVPGLTISKALNGSGSLNGTQWQLFLDPLENVFGICNGTIVFQAEQS